MTVTKLARPDLRAPEAPRTLPFTDGGTADL
jgi:hypothetical protein